MLGYYKYTREEIINKIKRSPKTKDGYYVCRKFKEWNKMLGEKLEKGKLYSRECFQNKICFNNLDLKRYYAEGTFDENIAQMVRRDEFIYDIIHKDLKLPLNKKLPGKKFTLSELIDATIFYFDCKFA